MDISQAKAMIGHEARFVDPLDETTEVVKVVHAVDYPAALVENEDGTRRIVRIVDLRPLNPPAALSEDEIVALRELLAQPKSA